MHSTSAAQSGSRALLNWYRNEEDETVAEFGEELKADFRAIEFTDRLGCWSRTISARESSSIASMVGSSDLFASERAALEKALDPRDGRRGCNGISRVAGRTHRTLRALAAETRRPIGRSNRVEREMQALAQRLDRPRIHSGNRR